MSIESFHEGRVALHKGDCLASLRRMPSASVDHVVTDPPYGIEFMGKAWDRGGADQPAFSVTFWREVLRVLKPGGHVLAFSANRTVHRMVVAIEDAGFEIRDALWRFTATDAAAEAFMATLDPAQREAFARCVEDSAFGGYLGWVFATGFPKSHDIARAIDAADTLAPRRDRALKFTAWMRSTGITSATIAGLTGSNMASHYLTAGEQPEVATATMFDLLRPALPEVPAEIEALVAARTVESENLKRREVVGHHEDAAQAARWREDYQGAQAAEAKPITRAYSDAAREWEGWGSALKPALEPICVARKPFSGTLAENVLAYGTGALHIDACRIEMSDEDRATINAMGGFGKAGWVTADRIALGAGLDVAVDAKAHDLGRWPANVVTDGSDEVVGAFPVSKSGSAARGEKTYASHNNIYGSFDKERSPFGYGDQGSAARFFFSDKADGDDRIGSKHPTVKPVDLMRWCVRLVARPGSIILDPFAGTGTTGEAAWREGMSAILCEREPAYQADIARRMELLLAGPARRRAESAKAREKRPKPSPLFGDA